VIEEGPVVLWLILAPYGVLAGGDRGSDDDDDV